MKFDKNLATLARFLYLKNENPENIYIRFVYFAL